jgi:hypothetical protein
MLKRVDKGGAWVLANNPRAKYWETPEDRSFIGNRHYRLERIVRASTAAPSYFEPQELEIVEGEKPALFVDGGLTPHNDPALALFLVAALPGHRIEWPLGADKLTIVSLGTGAYRQSFDREGLRNANSAAVAFSSLIQQIAEAQALILTLMSWLGQGGAPWPINSEIGDLSDREPPFGGLFRFKRYDIRLETEWLSKTLGVEAADLAAWRRFDNPDALHPIYALAQKAAALQMAESPIPPP